MNLEAARGKIKWPSSLRRPVDAFNQKFELTHEFPTPLATTNTLTHCSRAERVAYIRSLCYDAVLVLQSAV